MTESEQATTDTVKPERPTNEELEKLDKAGLMDQLSTVFDYIDSQKFEDIQALQDSEEKYRQQLAEVTRRESMLLKSLTEKEREMADLAAQIEELKQYQLPSTNQLRTMLLEPTVNVVINRLKKELSTTKLRLEESQSELNAWKFTQDSQTGKQLMARCRTLLKENEELGKQISQGRIAKLEGEIALEKKLVEEMKVAQNETEQFVMELDDDTEGLQATIYLLQSQLKEAKDRIDILEGSAAASKDKGDTIQQTDSFSAAKPMEQQATGTLNVSPVNTGDSLTLQEKVTANKVTPSESIANGTEVTLESASITSEKMTSKNAEVGGNGLTEVMVTN